jgi:hypothetical protein
MTTVKKTIAKKTASVSHIILAQASGVTDPLPTADPPSPPKGFVPSKLGRGNRPQHAQIELAPRAATELRTSTTYAAQFGSAAPDPNSVADALTLARSWSDKLKGAGDWHDYVRHQEHLAWKHAMALSAPLRAPFEYRQERDTTLSKNWPSLEAFFGAAKERALKGLATKKKNKEAAAQAAQTAAKAPAAPSKLLN